MATILESNVTGAICTILIIAFIVWAIIKEKKGGN